MPSTVTRWAKQKGHYDDLGYTSYFCWNSFRLLVFCNSELFSNTLKSATEILSRFQIYQITSFSFALSFLFCFDLVSVFSKLTNKSCHPERFLFWSVLDEVYWISFFSLVLYPCVGGVSREKNHGRLICWDLACLKMPFFTLILWMFGYIANLGIFFRSKSWRCFSKVFKLPVLLLTNLRPCWFIILCVPVPPPPPWNFSGMSWDGSFFILCAEHLKDTLNLMSFSIAKFLMSFLLLSLELLISVVLIEFLQILVFFCRITQYSSRFLWFYSQTFTLTFRLFSPIFQELFLVFQKFSFYNNTLFLISSLISPKILNLVET